MKFYKNFNYIFFIIWGLLFGGIPFIFLFSPEGENKWFLIIFVLIGFTGLAYGIRNLVLRIIDKQILKNGKETVATYVSKKGMGAMNNVPLFKVVYNFTNDKGEIISNVSSEVFTFEEVEKFEQTGKFKIKYKGSRSAIVPNGVVTNQDQPKQKCLYCGAEIDSKICSHCGAKNE